MTSLSSEKSNQSTMATKRNKEIAKYVGGSVLAYMLLEKLFIVSGVESFKTRGELRSLTNASLCSLAGALGVYTNTPNDPQAKSELTTIEKIGCSFAGYLIDDFFRLFRDRRLRKDFIFHHGAGITVAFAALLAGAPPPLYNAFGLLEASTVFLNLSHMSSDLLAKGSVRTMTKSAMITCFVASFIGLRIIYFPLLLRSRKAAPLRQLMGKYYVIWYAVLGLQLFWLRAIVKKFFKNGIGK